MEEKQRSSVIRFAFILPLLVVALVAMLAFPHSAEAAWSEPTDDPPGGNVAAPLNVSTVNQTKRGGLSIQGGLNVGTLPGNSWAISGISPDATSGQITSGVFGQGSNTDGGLSAGIYGLSYGVANAGTQVGLLGAAGANSFTSIGVYGTNNNFQNAYAGYFRGTTLVEGSFRVGVNPDTGSGGDISATRFCIGADCITSWPSGGGGGGESLFTENPPNNTYLTNTVSDLALGGIDSSSGAFYFNVSGSGRGSLFAEQSITIGEPSSAVNGNHFCETGEICTTAYDDCWDEQANCGVGNFCSAGTCAPLDATAPLVVGSVSVVTTTTTVAISFQTDEEATTNMNYKQGTGDPDSGGIPAPDPADTTADRTLHSINVDGLTPGTIYSYKLHLKDAAGNEYVSDTETFTTEIPVPDDTTPPSLPQNFSLNGNVTSSTIPLRWDASIDSGGSGLAGYRIYRCSGSSSCTPTLYFDTGTIATNFTDINLAPVTIYRYEVSAYDGNNNESAKSTRLTVTTTAQTGSGGSPAILKDQGGSLGGGGASSSSPAENLATNIYEKVESPLVEAIRPLSRLLGIPQAKARIGFFDIPSASAAAPFGGNSTVRMTINNGVLQINNGGAVMEIGNEAGHAVPGHDIASTGALYIRPNNSTAGSYFEGTGSTQNLVLTGFVRVGNTTNTTNGNIRYTGTDLEGYVNGAWKSLTSGGGGGEVDPSNYIWNSSNPPSGNPGGQQGNASINIGQSATIGTSLSAGSGTLQVTTGAVGIDLAPSGSYKLNVGGNINATGAFFRNGVTGVTSAPCNGDGIVVGDITVSGGIVTAVSCEPDDGGSGGGGIGGSGTTNAIPRFTSPNVLGDSVINQVSGNIGINRATPTQRLDVGGSAYIRGDFEVDTNDDGVRELTASINGTVANLIIGPYVSSQANIVANSSSIWARGATGDIIVGGTNFATGQVPGVPELCFSNSCIDSWSDLILNTDQFGDTPQPGGFNVAGNGRVGNSLTVVNGPLVLPTTSAALGNRIEKDGGILDGHRISTKVVFGGNVAAQSPNDPNAFGIGFVEDDDLTHPVMVIKENREVHLGYFNAGNDRAATRLCLYGSGSADCRNTWPSGGEGGVDPSNYIWNASNPPSGSPGGQQGNASINIGQSATIGTSLSAGAGTFHAIPSGIGVHTASPSASLEVAGQAIIGGDTTLFDTELLKLSGGTSQSAYMYIAGSKNGTTSENLIGILGVDGTGGSSNEEIYFGAESAATDLRLFAGSSNLLLDSNGNVGVGYTTTTPPSRFSVSGGHVRLDGPFDLLVGGTRVDGAVISVPEICLNDTCISTWPSGGGGGVDPSNYIWNASNPPSGNPGGQQGNASINIGQSATIGTSLSAGAGTLRVTTGGVGIDQLPGAGFKLDVLGAAQISGDLKLGARIKGADARESLRIQTLDGNIVIGPQNTSYAHILTDIGRFFFNKDIYTDGAFSSYNNDSLVFQTGGTSRITVLGNSDANAGFVGINTTTPTERLQVSDGTFSTKIGGNVIGFTRNTGPSYIRSEVSGGYLAFVTNGRTPSAANANLVLATDQNSYFNGNVGIGAATAVARLAVNNNLSGEGSAGDAIATYANSSNASALYAEQLDDTGYAGYFSGRVNITTSATIGGVTYNSGTRLIQCPPNKVHVQENSNLHDEWLTYQTCTMQNASTVRITRPQVCDGDNPTCGDLAMASPTTRTPTAVCWEYGLVYVSHTTGTNTGAYILAEPPTVPRPHVWYDADPPGGSAVRLQTVDCQIGNPPQDPPS